MMDLETKVSDRVISIDLEPIKEAGYKGLNDKGVLNIKYIESQNN